MSGALVLIDVRRTAWHDSAPSAAVNAALGAVRTAVNRAVGVAPIA